MPESVADEVIEWIGDGLTLRSYCRQPGKKSYKTIYRWREKDRLFATRFAHARDLGFDVLAEECLDIADNSSNDYMERQGKDGNSYTVVDSEHIQRSKLRIETRLKLLAKWCRQRYGEGSLEESDDGSEPDPRFE